MYVALCILWAVLYSAFIVGGVLAGWAWRRTYYLTASRRCAHAMLAGYLASVAGFGALVVGS